MQRWPKRAGSGYGNEKEAVWRDKIVEAPGSCVPAWKFYGDVGKALFGEKYPYFDSPEAMYDKFCEENVTLRHIPAELKMNALWCGWRLTDKGKVPFNLTTGEHAKSNDESTFALKALKGSKVGIIDYQGNVLEPFVHNSFESESLAKAANRIFKEKGGEKVEIW